MNDSELQVTHDEIYHTDSVVDELLTEDLTGKCVFNNVNEVFDAQTIEDLKTRKAFVGEATTEQESYCLQLNRNLAQCKSPLRAKIFLDTKNNAQKLFLEGKIGSDVMYMLVQEAYTLQSGNIGLEVEKFGCVGNTGKVLSFDGLNSHLSELASTPSVEHKTAMRFTSSSDPNNLNGHYSHVDFEGPRKTVHAHSIQLPIPDTPSKMATFVHEYGHQLDKVDMINAGLVPKIRAGMDQYKGYEDHGIPMHAARRVMTWQERNGWAKGVAVFKSLGRRTEVGMFNRAAIKSMLVEGQGDFALAAYDNESYDVGAHQIEAGPIPQFSSKDRSVHRRMDRLMRKRGYDYGQLVRDKRFSPYRNSPKGIASQFQGIAN